MSSIRFWALTAILILSHSNLSAQINGFYDDFEDGSLDTLWNGNLTTLWTTNAEDTYGISESGGIFNIDYSRSSQSSSTDYIRFASPADMDVSENPNIHFRIRSSTSTTLTVIAVFGFRGGISQEFTANVIGNNEWDDISLALDPDLFKNERLNYVFFYFDRNSGNNHLGDIALDNFKVAGFTIKIQDLTAGVENGNRVQLNWNSSDPAGTGSYKVYRDTEEDFIPSEENLITGLGKNSFVNTGLDTYTTYFYRISALDTLGVEYPASEAVMAQTYDASLSPEITISSVNSDEIGLYEEFALDLELNNVAINNPYNPEDIDVYAHFTGPDGETIRINGFYDNSYNADQWRLYFAPWKTGSWQYKVFVNDIAGMDSTESGSLTAVASESNGPVVVSEQNPNYLQFHNGASFYGIAVYFPWYVQENGLDRLKEYGLNFIGYWNGTYDGYGNGGGRYLVESMDSGVGRYDQRKLARIEQILDWLEDRDMQMMYAIWAHPFLRSGAPGWDPIDWPGHNPYQEIVDAEDFYTDSLAWAYQTKQYRYLMARLGHRKGLGIWEIINEIQGTTAYVRDNQAGIDWINKMHAWFKEHDPYKRATTASFESADVWNRNDVHADIANQHYYETQGYPRPYDDDIRDGLFNVGEVYKELVRSGERPSFLGEAGANAMFSSISSNGYTLEYHNAFWSGLASGMSSTPFWWDYTTLSIFTDERMEVYRSIKGFTDKLNFYDHDYTNINKEENGANIFSMNSDSAAFGWLWSFENEDVSGSTFNHTDLANGTVELEWYNTWQGETITTDTLVALSGNLLLTAPELETAKRDVAYRINTIENGTEAYALQILVPQNEIKIVPEQSYPIYLYVTDESGRLVDSGTHEISVSIAGNGTLDQQTLQTENGYAVVQYTPGTESEYTFNLYAESTGLETAELINIQVTGKEESTEDEIPAGFNLEQNYPNPFNPSTSIRFSLPNSGFTTLEVFDITGRKVSELLNKTMPAGTHMVQFDASSLTSGMYFYRLNSGRLSQIKKMILLK